MALDKEIEVFIEVLHWLFYKNLTQIILNFIAYV